MNQQIAVFASSTDSTLSAWDVQNGTFVAAFKGNASGRGCLCRLGRDYLIASQITRSALHFWTWHKDALLQRSFAAEPIVAVAASPDGAHVAGGGASGHLYLWQAASGRLLRTWPAHYKPVTALAFSDGGDVLLSGGEDTLVHAWLLLELLDAAAGGGVGGGAGFAGAAPASLHTWSEHTLPVTALLCGAGAADPFVASVSIDRTCKIYSLAQGTLLRSVSLPASLHSIAADPTQLALYIGAGDGRIFEVSLAGGGTEAAFAADAAAEFGRASGEAVWAGPLLEGHATTVTCLAFTTDGSYLVSGCEDGSARVWDVQTRQPLRTLANPANGPVTAVLVMDRPPFLVPGHARGGAAANSSAAVSVGGGGDSGRKGPQRLPPLLPFAKHVGAATSLQPWEGAPVLLDGSLPYRGIAADCGLSATELEQVVAIPLPSTSATSAMESVEILKLENGQLREALAEMQEHLRSVLRPMAT